MLDDPEYEDLIAEVYVDDECLMVVSQDHGMDDLEMEFLPRSDSVPWRLKPNLMNQLIDEAKTRFFQLRRSAPPAADELYQ